MIGSVTDPHCTMNISPKPAAEIEDPRRRFLLRALSLGGLAAGLGSSGQLMAEVLGKRPGKLAEGKSIFDVQGEVFINDQPATPQSRIAATDTLRTGKTGSLIAVLGQDAFLLRENSRLELGVVESAQGAAKQLFRLVNGALLTVFGARKTGDEVQLHTNLVIMGIRGTGVYVEAAPEQTYACTCYGRVQLTSAIDPAATEEIRSLHHDAPRYILAQPREGRRIIPAPFFNHTDLELRMLEALVGREVPFGLNDDPYAGPRRDYQP